MSSIALALLLSLSSQTAGLPGLEEELHRSIRADLSVASAAVFGGNNLVLLIANTVQTARRAESYGWAFAGIASGIVSTFVGTLHLLDTDQPPHRREKVTISGSVLVASGLAAAALSLVHLAFTF
jgi:hypothetical protein